MSGHSKWATIKRKKGATDAKRGKLFAKLVKAIELAAREGGGNVAGNAALAQAVAKAKANSLPADNIERAIKRGSGELEGVNYDEFWYEGYGAGGVAFFVHILTDNRNRAASDVRAAFTRNNGALGEPGSVGYLFENKGQILVDGPEEAVMLAALDGGAEDIISSGQSHEIITAPTELHAVAESLRGAGFDPESVDLLPLPKTTVSVDAATASKVLRLVDALEDLDDVQAVHANFDVDEDVMAALVDD